MKPLVSILIPAFNAQEWIADTIRSAIEQTWSRKEIIIVDDGSTDQTLSIAQGFASREVSIVSKTNEGASAARNNAFSMCQGEYIQWLDADDLIAPDKIAMQMYALNLCRSNRPLLSSAWGLFMYRIRTARFTPSPLWCDLSPVEWLLRKMGQNLQMQPATWLVSRELTEAAGPWNIKLQTDDDGEYFCRIVLASDEIRFVPEAKVFYRMSGFNGVSYIGRSDGKLEAQIESIRLHLKYLKSLEESERVRVVSLRYLQGWLHYFYPERLDLVEQLEQLAAASGGRLERPRLSWKYAWIEKPFGFSRAKRAQDHYNWMKSSLMRTCDKALFRLENRTFLRNRRGWERSPRSINRPTT